MQTATKTYTLVSDHLEDFRGHAALYKLSEPISGYSWDDEKPTPTYDYVVVSTSSFFGLETFIFGADAEGRILDWGELSGSRKETSSHELVLENAGYTLEDSEWTGGPGTDGYNSFGV